MTTRTEVLEAARQRIVKDGHCPDCLCDLVEFPGNDGVYCPRHMVVVYSLETGEMLGEMT